MKKKTFMKNPTDRHEQVFWLLGIRTYSILYIITKIWRVDSDIYVLHPGSGCKCLYNANIEYNWDIHTLFYHFVHGYQIEAK